MSTSTERIWTELHEDLAGFIRRRVPDEHVADDLVQETFVRIHENLDQLEDADRMAGWVFTIARNVIHEHYRRQPGHAAPLDEDAVAATPPGPLDRWRRDGAEWLRELIGALPETYREAVLLSELDGLTQQEVADRLGLSLSGAKSRIQRGRALLKESLERCCDFQFDRRGNLLDVDPKPNQTTCRSCDDVDGGCEPRDHAGA
jgi:RNA polymerase sigma-70 factor (ECF subfamily)